MRLTGHGRRATSHAALIAICFGTLIACDKDERPDAAVPAAGAMNTGTDQLAIRIPLAGGTARVFGYPALDSALWEAPTKLSAPARVFGFSANSGTIVGVAKSGTPFRLDLRVGGIDGQVKGLTGVTSADGSTIYGLTTKGAVRRLTPAGSWSYQPPRAVQGLFPLNDGSLVLTADDKDRTRIWKMRPPDTSVVDTGSVPRAFRVVKTAVGDRLYLAGKATLFGVRTRELTTATPIEVEKDVRAIVPTPSGDRIYLIQDSAAVLLVVDRYRDAVVERITLPGEPREARMDPLGRYILVRPQQGDSAWVVAVGSDRLLGTIASSWRDDLPAVGPDGSVLTVKGADIIILEPETLRGRRRVAGGARDYWYFFGWNGFRPRAAGLDEPVQFGGTDSLGDSVGFVIDSVVDDEAWPDTNAAGQPAAPPAAPLRGFIVSFAALLDIGSAQVMAEQIRGEGLPARVLTSIVDGATVHRVVLGPYPSRADAERAARVSSRPFWIYEAQP